MEKLRAVSEFFTPPVIALCARLRFCMIYASANSFTRGKLDDTRIPNQTKCFTMRNLSRLSNHVQLILFKKTKSFPIVRQICECLFISNYNFFDISLIKYIFFNFILYFIPILYFILYLIF